MQSRECRGCPQLLGRRGRRPAPATLPQTAMMVAPVIGLTHICARLWLDELDRQRAEPVSLTPLAFVVALVFGLRDTSRGQTEDSGQADGSLNSKSRQLLQYILADGALMIGLQKAVLDGLAIPAVVVGNHWDHTYVNSSCGLVWGCFGRSQGGLPICSAPGSSTLADCLSQTGSRAGIRYGITGVCHQAANRILYATRPQPATVQACRGYSVSEYAYGPYGLGSWPQRLVCDPPSAGGGGSLGAMIMGTRTR